MLTVDKDLRHSVSAIRARHHLLALFGVMSHVYLGKRDAFRVQKPFGCMAKATQRRGVNFNVLHGRIPYRLPSI